jgi:hypothetical protein
MNNPIITDLEKVLRQTRGTATKLQNLAATYRAASRALNVSQVMKDYYATTAEDYASQLTMLCQMIVRLEQLIIEIQASGEADTNDRE